MKRFTRVLPIVAGAIAGGVIALIIASSSSSTRTVSTTVVQPGGGVPTSLSSTARGMSINQIYHHDSPGVVDILVTSQGSGGSGPLGLFGGGGTQQQTGEGAGVVLNRNGDIVTDEHVVSGATSVTVTFQNGVKARAKVVGTDSSTDVGVIKVNVPSSELHPITLTNSSAAQVGDPVVAIGSPFSLPETVTSGIISATGRSIQAPNNYTITGAIQTDAPINPGNSGGPLLDANGQVLGLNDQIETNNTTASGEGSSSGVGFAIPSNTVTQIANDLIAGHKIRHSYVGVELNGNSTGGAQISSVTSNSPAAAAGLKPGDLITAVDGSPVTSTEGFISKVGTYQPGQTVTLTVKRNGSTVSIKVKLGTRPNTVPSSG